MNLRYSWRRDYNKYRLESLLTENSIVADFKKQNKVLVAKGYFELASSELLAGKVESSDCTYIGFHMGNSSEAKTFRNKPTAANNIHPMLQHIVVDKYGVRKKTANLLGEYNINEESIDLIRQTAFEILEELRVIIFITRKIGADEFFSQICDSLFSIGELMGIDECKQLVGDEWFEMMIKFAQTKTPFTKTLMEKYIHLNFVHKLSNSSEHREMFNALARDLEDVDKATFIMKAYINKALPVYVVNTILDNFVAFTTLSTEARRRYAGYCYTGALGVSNVENHGLSTGEALRSATRKIMYVRAIGGPRLATTNEIEQGVEDLFEEDDNLISTEETRYMTALSWVQFGADEDFYMVVTGVERNLTKFLDKLERISGAVNEATEWTESSSFDKIIPEVKKRHHIGRFKYPDYAEDEITSENHIQSIIKYINSNKALALERNRGLAYSIASEYERKRKELRFVKLKLTVKQIQILRDAYKIMTGTAEEAANDKGPSQEVVASLQSVEAKRAESLSKILLACKQAGKIPPNAFVFQIISTLERGMYLRVSAKQLRIIEEDYMKYGQNFAINMDEMETDIFALPPAELGAAEQIEPRQKESSTSYSSITSISDLLGSGKIVSL